MIVVKRHYENIDPDDPNLSYRYDRDVEAIKATQKWIDLKASLDADGQISPILIDRFYDSDFNLTATYVTDGFKRWIAVQDDELAWDTMECIVTSWVNAHNSIQIDAQELVVDPTTVVLDPSFAHEVDEYGVITGDSVQLTAEKSPPDFPSQVDWLANNPGMDADDYTTAKSDYDTNYKAAWANIDSYVENNSALETVADGYREMFVDGDGNFYYSSVRVNNRNDSLGIVSAKERLVATVQVNVRTIDRTGLQPQG
jgi:hypothetical protein